MTTLTFNNTEEMMQRLCIRIEIPTDQSVEDAEVFSIVISTNNSLVMLTRQSANITINDNTSKSLKLSLVRILIDMSSL